MKEYLIDRQEIKTGEELWSKIKNSRLVEKRIIPSDAPTSPFTVW